MDKTGIDNSLFAKEYYFVDIQQLEEYIKNMDMERANVEYIGMMHYLQTTQYLTSKARVRLIDLLKTKISQKIHNIIK